MFGKISASVTNWIKNEVVRRKAAIERELASRVDQRILRWFGHVERMDELGEFNAAIFAWHCVLSDRPPMLWWLSHGEGRDAVT